MYKLYKTAFGKDAAMKQNEDGTLTSFFFDPENADYKAYLKWLEEGNTPLSAEE